VSQESLARRAGLTQASVSRIESGQTSPRWDTVRALLLGLGLEPGISPRPLRSRANPAQLAAIRRRAPEDRLALAISANRLAARLNQAGRDAGD